MKLKHKFSRIVSQIVMAIAGQIDKDEVVCRSTEEMMAEIERVNVMEDKDDLILSSTDVSAMYPSLDIPQVARDRDGYGGTVPLPGRREDQTGAGLPGPGGGCTHQGQDKRAKARNHNRGDPG